MASTITATTGSSHHPIVDLDAGTALPRVVQVAIIALLIGILALLAFAAAPNRQPRTTVPTAVRPETLTVPALRPPWSAAGPLGPERPIGPVAAVNLASFRTASTLPPGSSTGTSHERD